MRVSLLAATLPLLLGLPAAAAEPTRFAYAEPHMGTLFRIVLYAPNQTTADRAARAAYARAAALNDVLSDYKATSELMRLCAQAGGGPVKVSDDLFLVLERAKKVAEDSGGAFDVTCGPVVRLWRLARRNGKMPTDDELTAARALVGSDKILLDAEKKTIKLAKAGMRLDLGGIAKGYTADRMMAELGKHGIDRALVAAGGDVRVGKRPPDADGWKVGLAPVDDPNKPPRRFLMLEDAAVSTSGDAEQYVEIGGVRYSHIVDPRTGIGLVGRMSASVVAADGMTADSLTKVVAVLGPEKGFPIVERTAGASASFTHKTDKGEETTTSKRFPKTTP